MDFGAEKSTAAFRVEAVAFGEPVLEGALLRGVRLGGGRVARLEIGFRSGQPTAIAIPPTSRLAASASTAREAGRG